MDSKSNATAPYMGAATGIPVSSGAPSYYSEPPQQAFQGKTEVPWSTGLCDCGSDVSNCCITFWCPCITFGQIAEIVDKGSSSCGAHGALYTLIACVTGCPCFYSCFYRSKMRQQYMLQENPCGDCFVHCCCEACALCQEYRELKNRGFDMSIGWHGNVERQNRGVANWGLPHLEVDKPQTDVPDWRLIFQFYFLVIITTIIVVLINNFFSFHVICVMNVKFANKIKG